MSCITPTQPLKTSWQAYSFTGQASIDAGKVGHFSFASAKLKMTFALKKAETNLQRPTGKELIPITAC